MLFGVGMQLGNGCGSGTLYAAGGGSRRMWVVLPFFCAGGTSWIAGASRGGGLAGDARDRAGAPARSVAWLGRDLGTWRRPRLACTPARSPSQWRQPAHGRSDRCPGSGRVPAVRSAVGRDHGPHALGCQTGRSDGIRRRAYNLLVVGRAETGIGQFDPAARFIAHGYRDDPWRDLGRRLAWVVPPAGMAFGPWPFRCGDRRGADGVRRKAVVRLQHRGDGRWHRFRQPARLRMVLRRAAGLLVGNSAASAVWARGLNHDAARPFSRACSSGVRKRNARACKPPANSASSTECTARDRATRLWPWNASDTISTL